MNFRKCLFLKKLNTTIFLLLRFRYLFISSMLIVVIIVNFCFQNLLLERFILFIAQIRNYTSEFNGERYLLIFIAPIKLSKPSTVLYQPNHEHISLSFHDPSVKYKRPHDMVHELVYQFHLV